MSYSNDLTDMFSCMERTAENLLSVGETRDALVLLTSESIIRAHFDKRIDTLHAATQQCGDNVLKSER